MEMNKLKKNKQHTNLFFDNEPKDVRVRVKGKWVNISLFGLDSVFENGCSHCDKHPAAYFTHPWFDFL